jgi:HTH-type transcriptional regulator/antitoxin HigA
MDVLKYKIIKSNKQYNDYCEQLETLLDNNNKSKSMKEEIELLTFLIEKWDNEHNSFDDVDPIQLLKSLMDDRNMKPISLAELLGVSKGLVSDILHYKKGLSKEIIRKLADTFKLSHEAFNRQYDLVTSVNGSKASSGKVSSQRRVAV